MTGGKYRRRWLILAVGAVLSLVLVFAAVLPGLALGSDAARSLVVTRLEAMTGRHVSIDGRIDFSVLPQAQLSLEHVRLGDDDFTIDTLVANFSLFDVIAGKGNVSRLLLVRPEWRMSGETVDGLGGIIPGTDTTPENLEAASGGFHTGLQALLSRMDGIRDIEIRDGLFRPAGQGSASPRGISNANVRIAQSASADRLSLSGGFVWNGQPSTVDLDIDADAPLKEGGRSSVDFSLDSPALVSDFTGTARLADLGHAQGRLTIAAPSFNRAIEWLFAPGIRIPELGVVDFAGNLVLTGNSAELQEARVMIGASEGRGAMEARLDGAIPIIGGTLAFDDLNLTPIARSIAPYPRNAIDFERPLSVDFASAVQMEIRLSASELTLGAVPFNDVAAVVSVGGGIAKLDVGDAAVFGGRGQAAISVDGRNGQPSVEGWLSASGIDTASMMSGLSIGSFSISGETAIRAKLAAPASNWRTILSGLAAEASLDSRNGAISGFDPRIFAEPGARPLAAGSGDGSIPFIAMEAELALSGTTLELDKVTIRNEDGVLNASGHYFPRTNEIDVAGEFAAGQSMLVSANATVPPPPPSDARRIAFSMKGGWPDPAVTTRTGNSQ